MAAGIVGFSPATNPVVTGATTAPEQEGGSPNLFAMLLALIGGQPTAPNDGKAGTATLPAPGHPASSAAAVAPELATTASPKPLLKDLADALIALNDALEAGQPVDPALDDKLTDALDALATWLGTATPPPAVDPRIAALASGETLLPAAPVESAPAAPANEPDRPAPPAGSTISSPAPTPTLPAELAALIAELLPAAPEETDTQKVVAEPIPTPLATKLHEAPPALQALGLVIGKLSQRLEPTDPELAKKLDALAEGLKSGAMPDELATALGLDDSSAEPEIARIVEALTAPKPTTAPAPAQPFTAPRLTLPTELAADPPPLTGEADQPHAGEGDNLKLDASLDAPEPAGKQDIAQTGSRPTITAEPSAFQAEAKSAAPATSQPAAPATSPAAQLAEAVVPAARAAHAAYQVPVQQVNLPQVAFQIARQFEAGNSRFQIRLDPADLGRIDVSLEVEKSGTVSARMVVERPETLDLMQRDQRALQQALQQAGLDPGKTSLEFSLRQNPFAQQGGMADGQGGQSRSGSNGGAGGDALPGDQQSAPLPYRGTATAGGVNLFV